MKYDYLAFGAKMYTSQYMMSSCNGDASHISGLFERNPLVIARFLLQRASNAAQLYNQVPL